MNPNTAPHHTDSLEPWSSSNPFDLPPYTHTQLLPANPDNQPDPFVLKEQAASTPATSDYSTNNLDPFELPLNPAPTEHGFFAPDKPSKLSKIKSMLLGKFASQPIIEPPFESSFKLGAQHAAYADQSAMTQNSAPYLYEFGDKTIPAAPVERMSTSSIEDYWLVAPQPLPVLPEYSSAEKREGCFVKDAPVLAEQVNDTSRTTPITYVQGVKDALGTSTENLASLSTISEHKSLVALHDFLEAMVVFDGSFNADYQYFAERLSHYQREAASMLESISFIGKPEYDEAAAGIADSWRKQLTQNPTLHICVVTGKIDPYMVKSDAFLLDNILKNFTDEELETWEGRFLTDPEDLITQVVEPEDAKIILLDDWTISGSQLQSASWEIINTYPEYVSALEVQLVAAPAAKIMDGLDVSKGFNAGILNVPVHSYFRAHKADKRVAPYSQAHITGYHCAVDYDFNIDIAQMAKLMEVPMPPATNIVRPYRSGAVQLTQVNRVRRPYRDDLSGYHDYGHDEHPNEEI